MNERVFEGLTGRCKAHEYVPQNGRMVKRSLHSDHFTVYSQGRRSSVFILKRVTDTR